MKWLTRLQLQKFRNVAPTTLEFRPGLNVLLGRNATGKTTLLRLLADVLGSGLALRENALEVDFHARGELLAYTHRIVIEPEEDEGEDAFPPRSVTSRRTDFFELEEQGRILEKVKVLPDEVVHERTGSSIPRPLTALGDPFIAALLALWKAGAGDELAERFIMARPLTAGRMDEGLERFASLFDTGTDAPEPFWSEFIHRLHEHARTLPAHETSGHQTPAFLERAARILGYDSAEVCFRIQRSHPGSEERIALSHLYFLFKLSREAITQERLSHGQKRLLTFFACADESRDVIVADELANGLHPEWIDACVKEIGDRQAFLTSQNPLLLDFLRFDGAEEVRRTFILCERASHETEARLVWRNPTEEEAESFFSAYQTGIQRVSDILRTQGLW